ncbi:MAG: pentapeptide repeat-containing protein [Rhodobacteraceae bacterium]|nr:pentapeptide repeat-containing protein [Paracoccaceae bacterium]
MPNAQLRGAQLNGADLSDAQLNGADLYLARLNEANLIGAQLNGSFGLRFAELRGAWARHLDFTDVTIPREQLHEMFGDASVILPEALQPPPAHWPTVDSFWFDARDEWKSWLQDPDGYVFDPTRYGDRYTDQTGE